MKHLKRGTPEFGVLCGIALVISACLVMWIGFWKTLILLVLFALGYFLGAVNNKEKFFKDTMNKVIPEKKNEPIDIRASLTREQDKALQTKVDELLHPPVKNDFLFRGLIIPCSLLRNKSFRIHLQLPALPAPASAE